MSTSCANCGRTNQILFALHGAAGGPSVCVGCSKQIRGVRETRRPLPRLDTDWCKQALVLTHPDHHPPERHELAARVTATLIEYRRYAPPPRNDSVDEAGGPFGPRDARQRNVTHENPDFLADVKAAVGLASVTWPCERCCGIEPKLYCDNCRAVWDEVCRVGRQRRNERRRERRARRRQEKPPNRCEHCGEPFVSTRSDARYCSTAHRVAAHRARKHEGSAAAR